MFLWGPLSLYIYRLVSSTMIRLNRAGEEVLDRKKRKPIKMLIFQKG